MCVPRTDVLELEVDISTRITITNKQVFEVWSVSKLCKVWTQTTLKQAVVMRVNVTLNASKKKKEKKKRKREVTQRTGVTVHGL